MKNIKNILLATLLCVIFQGYIYCQTIDWTEKYSYTILYDDFSNSQIDLNNWRIENNAYFFRTVFIDSPATVSVNSGNLLLSAISCPNCTSGGTTSNWAGGKVISKDKFQYGIFESHIHFAGKQGTDACFLLRGGNDVPCGQGGLYETEIDIATNWWDLLSPFYYLTHDIRDYHIGTDCVDDYVLRDRSISGTGIGSYFTFKCIWTPSYVRYYLDNSLKFEILNTGQEWFPKYLSHLSLFQALGTIVPIYIDVPQTTYVDYVSVKKFFATPKITLNSSVICTTGMATMDVDPAASNITWVLTPSYLFSGATTGTGINANIIASSTLQGKGKITYSFNMSTDKAIPKETYTATKDIWIKGPDASEVSFDVYKSNGVRATYTGYAFLLCPNTTYQIYVMNSGPVPLSNYIWTVPTAWTRYYTMQNIISINTNSTPGGRIFFTATNTASGCNNTIQTVTGYMGSTTNCGTYSMIFTPNPSTSETTLELSADGEKVVDENTQWELEVYDQQQGLKEKSTKIKGKQTKINTSNWKDGIYLVRVKIGEELISEKLMVQNP